MSEEKDPLMRDMMSDGKRSIYDPAFRDVIMNNIIMRDKKRARMMNMLYYSIPLLFTGLLILLFAGPVMRQVDSIKIDLNAEKILQSLSGVSRYIRLLAILLILALVQKLISRKADPV